MPHDAGGLVLSTRARRIEILIWVLVYGGLLLGCLSLFMLREGAELGWPLLAVGLLLAAVGVGLIFVRARQDSMPP